MLPSLFTVLLSLFFLVLGILGMILPWSTAIRTEVVDFLLSNTVTLSLFGFSFFVIGVGVLVQLACTSKRQYLTLTHHAVNFDISEKVISDYLSVYFRDLYPSAEVPCQLTLKKKKAKILADLPYCPKEQQKELLKKIEGDLSDIFRDLIGYPYELLFSISFAPLEP